MCSIGMASSKRRPTMPMGHHMSPSVQLYHRTASCTTFHFFSLAKRYCPLLTSQDIDRLNSSRFKGTYWYHSHFRNQYCDGLRGVLVIYDPDDPQKHLYDVDNGEIDMWDQLFFLAEIFLKMIPSSLSPIGTIIFRRNLLTSRKFVSFAGGVY